MITNGLFHFSYTKFCLSISCFFPERRLETDNAFWHRNTRAQQTRNAHPMLVYDIGPAPPPPLYKGRALDPPRAPLCANLCNKIQAALQQLRFGVFGYGKNVPTRINQSSVIISHNLNSFYINKMHAINTTATIITNQSYLKIKLGNISENELLC